MRISDFRNFNTIASEPQYIAEHIVPSEIEKKSVAQETFVINIVTSWCPDCTVKQIVNLKMFSELLVKAGIKLYQCNVQDERGVFLSEECEELTSKCGGHGYPRTVLIKNGKIADSNNVEIVSIESLTKLSNRFLARCANSGLSCA